MNAPEITAAPLPRILILGTGGTIAGSTTATDEATYQAGVVDVGELIRAVPGVPTLADVSYEQVCQIDSCDMTLERQLDLAEHVEAALDRDDVDAVVITHGTDTLEETAYLLHLVIRSEKPVVVVGAMRPSDAVSADGPANLRDAIKVAAAPSARGLGTLAVLCDEIHSGRELVKQHTTRVNAFGSAHGPLGELTATGPRFYARPTRAFGAQSHVAGVRTAAPVEVVFGRAGLPAPILAAYVDSGTRGVVYVGHGGGNVPLDLRDALADVAARGVPVVRTSRVGSGVVGRNDAVPDDRYGLIAGDDLNPAKARILLALALTVTQDPTELQAIFDTH